MVWTIVYLVDNTIIHGNTLGVDDRSALGLTFVTVDGVEDSFLLDTDDGSLDGIGNLKFLSVINITAHQKNPNNIIG